MGIFRCRSCNDPGHSLRCHCLQTQGQPPSMDEAMARKYKKDDSKLVRGLRKGGGDEKSSSPEPEENFQAVKDRP